MQIGAPYKGLLCAWIAAILVSAAVIFVGFLIERFEQIELKFFSGLFGSKIGLIIEDRLTFPGTMLHEIAHALFAWMTGAKLTKVKLLTFFDSHRLGYVNFSTQGTLFQQYVQLSLASCAPVIMGWLELRTIMMILTNMTTTTPVKVLLIYLFISIFNHMSMSDQDIKNYVKGLTRIFPLIYIICYTAWYFHGTHI